MGRAKIIFGDQVLQDLTQDTVTPEVLMEGYTAHAANGERIIGTASGGVSEDEMIAELREAEVIEGKNFLDNKATTTEINGITFTVHTDKSVTLNGTSTTGFEYYLTPNNRSDDIIPQGKDYVLSAGITLPEKIFLDLKVGSTSVTIEPTESYKQFTASSNVNSVCLIIRNNTTFNNLRVYPMICTEDEWNKSHTYEPYYVPVKDAMFRREEQRILGAKNFMPNNAPFSYSQGGINFTKHNDGSFSSTSGTTSENVNGYHLLVGYLLPAGTYIFSGFPDGTNTNPEKVFLELKNSWGTATQIARLDANHLEVEFTLVQDTLLYARPYFISGESIPYMTFKPMIRLATDPDDTYVSYCMTNAELTEEKLSISDQQVLGAWNLWDDTISLRNNNSGGNTKTSDGYDIQCTTTAYSGSFFDKVPVRSKYEQYGTIRLSFEYKGDIACSAQIGALPNRHTGTLPTTWTKYDEVFDVSTIDYIVFYNMDTTKAPKISIRNIMISLPTSADLPYVAPTMTNRELTEVKTGTITATVDAYGTIADSKYCIIGRSCWVYLEINTTSTWSTGKYINLTNTNLPENALGKSIFGLCYPKTTITCQYKPNGDIAIRNDTGGAISSGYGFLLSLCVPI